MFSLFSSERTTDEKYSRIVQVTCFCRKQSLHLDWDKTEFFITHVSDGLFNIIF